MARTLQDLVVGVSPLTNTIFAGYTSKKEPNCFTSKVDVTDQVIRAIATHMQESKCNYEFPSGTLTWIPAQKEDTRSEPND